MIDNPATSMPATQRLQLLRDRQTWLEKFNHRQINVASSFVTPGRMTIYDFQQGILTVGDGRGDSGRPTRLWYRKIESRLIAEEASQWSSSDFPFEIREFTTDPTQDLIVILEFW